ncbi:MAG TPA: TfoX/Sxy family protein [Phycisphaerae bacterium]|nr:TfoX/Sxy family protein [Phycisphaerae bacterium]HRW55199.1 TfoX/Sxy family protein [Phycisphaerae bacterium]
MAYSEALAGRMRRVLARRRGIGEKKMFGGLAFLLHGNMACGIVGDDLMLRLGDEGVAEALCEPGTRPMDFTGKPLKSMVYVSAEAVESDDALRFWIDRATTFVRTLPKKAASGSGKTGTKKK